MAGRGTDIKLGDGVPDLGGLFVIGTERHESRRIDNQLRGRSGRQGDPGVSQFYLSMEDVLMRRFGSENMQNMLNKMGMEEDTPLESRMVSRAVEQAQKRVEGHNFDARKQILEYDDVMREQRDIIYEQRMEVLESENLEEIVQGMIHNVVDRTVARFTSEEEVPEDWDLAGLVAELNAMVLYSGDITQNDLYGLEQDEIQELVKGKAAANYKAKEAEIGEEKMREFEKVIMLRAVDRKWMNHIDQMDQLRQGIHLRAYGQSNPLRDYRFEGYNMFEDMVASIEEEVSRYAIKARLKNNMEREAVADESKSKAVHGNNNKEEAKKKKQPIRKAKQAGRNEPCPCGSGKKYKHCCGAQGA